MKLLKDWERDYISDRPLNKELFHSERRISDVYQDGRVVEWIIQNDARKKDWLIDPIGNQDKTKVVWE